MSSSAALPQELCDSIIDYLHDDVKTLQCCSLVCHAWLSTASVHLFSCLHWPPCSKPGTISCPQDSRPGQIVSSLHAALQTSPRLTSNVRDFSIAQHTLDCRIINNASLEESEITTLLQILSCFPHLRKLSVTKFPLQIVPPPPEFLGALNVDELLVHSDYWSRRPGSTLTMTVEHLLPFLSCFNGVKKLHVEGKFGDPLEDISPMTGTKTPLRVESLSISTQGHVLEALHTALDFQTVQRLQFAALPEEPVPSLASMTNLRSLEYHGFELTPATVLAGGPAVSELTLHGALTVFTHPKWAQGSYIFPWREIVRDLGALDTSALRVLVVHVPVHEGHGAPALPAQVADVLRELRHFFVGLEEVVLARCAALERVEMRLVEGHPLGSWHVFQGFERAARESFVSERMQGIFHVEVPQGDPPLEHALPAGEDVPSKKSFGASLRAAWTAISRRGV